MRRPGPAPTLTDALREGVDSLAVVDGLDVLEGPTWNGVHERWVLRCRLTIPPGPEPRVPARTTWYVLIQEAYPAGRVTVYPASVGGITDTFPHQNRNTQGPEGQLWRDGDICVDQGSRALGRLGGSTEPIEAAERLAWRMSRALDWVRAASVGMLVGAGDPFELPDFGVPHGDVVGFSEDRESFRCWEECTAKVGTVEVYTPPSPPKFPTRTVVRAYRTLHGELLYEPKWGKAFEPISSQAPVFSIWVRLPEVPHLPPWKAPETWGELAACATQAGIDLGAMVQAGSNRLRRSNRGLLMCGFPMPTRVGGENVEYFWQALRLPQLSSAKGSLRGFRNNEHNRQLVDRLTHFRQDSPLVWVRSENWHPSTRSARGRFSQALAGQRVLLIGGGAVGSVLAELLVRGGLEQLTLCDGELTVAGNLARHTLTLHDIGLEKAVALAERLNEASPYARVNVLDSTFPPTRPEHAARAREADLIIDCTGEDEVAQAMATFNWDGDRTFWSISLDWEARRSLFFLARGATFPAATFLNAVRARLSENPSQAEAHELSRDGIGCWHPVMPARVDDVWMLAAIAVHNLDRALQVGNDLQKLVVFERDESRPFSGVRRVS